MQISQVNATGTFSFSSIPHFSKVLTWVKIRAKDKDCKTASRAETFKPKQQKCYNEPPFSSQGRHLLEEFEISKKIRKEGIGEDTGETDPCENLDFIVLSNKS